MNSHLVALLRLSWQLFTHPGWVGLAMVRSSKCADCVCTETSYVAGPAWAIVDRMDALKADGWRVWRSWA
jgi:hypothetical protein